MEHPHGIYHHFKDATKLYEIVGVATHTETLEELVVYRPLYEGAFAPLVVRPLLMFMETIDRPEYSYRGPRFVKVSDAPVGGDNAPTGALP